MSRRDVPGRRARSAGEAPAQRGARSGRAPARSPAAWRLQQLQALLDAVLTWSRPADAVLSHWLRDHGSLGPRERGELAEAYYDVLRHLRRYRQVAQSGPGVENRLLALQGLAATQPVAWLRPALTADEHDWFQHVQAIDPASLPMAVRHSLPDWLAQRLAGLPMAEELAAALNQPAPLDVRINPLNARRDEVWQGWQGTQAAYQPQPTPYSPWGIRLSGRPAIQRWPEFVAGQIEVQDEGSQLVAALVQPRRGDVVVDYCAGAGGKTLLLGALMRGTGRLFALDVSAARLARAKPRLARAGLSNVVTMALSGADDDRLKRLWGKADRVLVDAPCTGMGTLRRNPDLKWRQGPEQLVALRQMQADVLSQAARCVAPGGRLVYVTCSVLPEENEKQVEAFLARHQGYTVLSARDVLSGRIPYPDAPAGLDSASPWLRLRPDWHGTDGFFAAVLQRDTH